MSRPFRFVWRQRKWRLLLWRYAVKLFAPEITRATYRGALHREPDRKSERIFVGFLAETRDLDAFIAELLDSAEFKQKSFNGVAPRLIKSTYQSLIGREPHADEAAQALKLVKDGDLTSLVNQVVHSREFDQRYRDRTFIPELITAVYQALLGREPDPDGERLSRQFVANNPDLAAFMAEVLESAEFKYRSLVQLAPRLVKSAYQSLLARYPDATALAADTTRVTKERTLTGLLNQLVQSPDFYQNYRNHTFVPEIIDGVYRGVLGRKPDMESKRLSAELLANGQDLGAFIEKVLDSTEFKQRTLRESARELAQSVSRAGLECDPNENDLAAYASKLVKEGGLTPVLKALINLAQTDPAFSGTNLAQMNLEDSLTPNLVRIAFVLIMGQAPMRAEVQSHLRRKTLGSLRDALLRSTEFRSRWNKLLSRSRPAPGDIKATKTVFVHILKTGGTTLHEALTPFFSPAQICPERFDGIDGYTSGELARYRFFSGHFKFEDCELIPGPKRVITMLRHPVTRLVSHYNFLCAHTEEYAERNPASSWAITLAQRYEMAEFFSLEEIRTKARFNNVMVRTLSSSWLSEQWKTATDTAEASKYARQLLQVAKKNLRSLLAFGILERYQESIELIFSALGLQMPSRIEPKMVLKDLIGSAPTIKPNVKPQVCDQRSFEAIAPLIDLDLEFYNYALELFNKRIQILKVTPTTGKSQLVR